MLKEIEFQGHIFTLREDGLYECHDDFEFDKNDWGTGKKYIKKMLLTKYIDSKEVPWLLHDSSQGNKAEEEKRFEAFCVANQNNIGQVYTAPSMSWEGLLL